MDMKYVRGRRERMVSVGWENFILQIEFRGGQRYQYGGVPKEVSEKLLRAPYPDNYFNKTVRGKYVSKRVDDLPPVAKPLPEYDMSDLPF